ncbi:ribonuclease H-like domain-containing protein [Bacillus sp. FJAT-47783]|uniref:ribonuclease H-like domain-containing protein n=1 Tax=Bacillus sp. FJAT-47783 TaxID=2922712 RepID=UPI001FAB8E47|nr:ribonuclease H-like domain-containing protein [Bacillus sp. FJAT-47783]
MSIKNKLNRLKKHMAPSREQKWLEKQDDGTNASTKRAEEVPFVDEWADLRAQPNYFDGQYTIVRTVTYPLTYKHGLYKLGELKEVVKKWNEQMVDHPLSAYGHDAVNLFFFDTETTGLKGGAGNMIFLLGHARLDNDQVVIKQHFLPSPGHEVALYKSFLSEVNIETLVTYNGKAFDWPQVKSRHAFIRNEVPKLPAYGHFDLYHGSRRLWKDRLDSLKLSVIEKDILNITRNEDTPGYLAPMLYFHFLNNPDPNVISGVLKHNEIDVLSLITLYIHISKMLLNASAFQGESYYIAKWFQTTGNEGEAVKTYEQLNKEKLENVWKAKIELSFLYKKEGKFDQAVQLWKELKESPLTQDQLNAHIELAKYYEHRVKKIDRALKETDIALQQLLKDSSINRRKREKFEEDLRKRQKRLIQKLKRRSLDKK